LILAGSGILLAVVAGVFVLYRLFSGGPEPAEPGSQTFEFPQNEIEEAELAPEEEPEVAEEETGEPDPLPDQVIVDDLGIVYAPSESTVDPVDSFTVSAPSVSNPPPSNYDEFLESGLIYEDAPYDPVTVITPFSMTPPPMTTINPLAPVGVLDKDDLDDCGNLSISPNISSVSAGLSDIRGDSSTKCLGEAVGNGCSVAMIDISYSDIDGYAYVAPRTGGDCGFNISNSDNSVSLCSIKAIMDSGSNSPKTESEWIDEFDDDPANMMTDLVYFMMTNTGVSFGCDVYTIE